MMAAAAGVKNKKRTKPRNKEIACIATGASVLVIGMGKVTPVRVRPKHPQPQPGVGPAMAALSEIEQSWVRHFILNGDGNKIKALRDTGMYEGRNDTAAQQMAYIISHDPKVLAALQEEGRAFMVAFGPVVVQHLTKIAMDFKHKEQARVLIHLFGALGLQSPVEHKHTHEHRLSGVEMREQVMMMAEKLGRPEMVEALRKKLALLPAPVQEAEYEEIDPA